MANSTALHAMTNPDVRSRSIRRCVCKARSPIYLGRNCLSEGLRCGAQHTGNTVLPRFLLETLDSYAALACGLFRSRKVHRSTRRRETNHHSLPQLVVYGE